MKVPLLKQGDCILASIQTALTDDDLIEFRNALGAHLAQNHSKALVLDVAALDVIDAFGSRMIREFVQTARLRGARTVVVGIQAEVAFAMAQLGLDLGGADTALDLEEALEILREKPPTLTKHAMTRQPITKDAMTRQATPK